MHRYDYSFLKTAVPGKIVGLTGVIAELRAAEEFRKLQYAGAFESLRKKAIVESVKGSNAMEGVVTSEARIREIVKGDKPLTHDEKEIAGYKDALKRIHADHANMETDEATVLYLHKSLLGQTDPAEAGKYKKSDNYILETDPEGKRRVRFRPVRAKAVQSDMEQLLLAYYEARQDPEIPSLLLIPCFILDLLCIHPFRDGNGRVSRLLTVLLLYQAGYDIVRYISFEGQIDRYKESYYEALESSSAGWHENENDYLPVMLNFLRLLYQCFREFDDAFTAVSPKKSKKNERVERILLNAVVPVSKRDVMDKVPDVGVKTVELVLSRMQKEGKIKKIGTYRNARYVKNPEKS